MLRFFYAAILLTIAPSLFASADDGAIDIFIFRSDAATNLHDYLYWQAQENGPRGEKAECIASLDQGQQAGWADATAYYQQNMGSRHHRTDPLMLAVRQQLVGERPKASEGTEEVWALIDTAMPAYEACFWVEHDARNAEWIAEARTLVETHGDAMRARIAAAYRVDWTKPMVTDVVSYAGWAGANTIVDPNHIMISSVDEDYRDISALEMLYHEASHTILDPNVAPTSRLIIEASAQHNQPPPRNLWHAVLFYTTGYAAQQVAAAHGIEYRPYMLRNGVFEQAHPMLIEHWTPYLDGDATLEEAVEKTVAAVFAAAE